MAWRSLTTMPEDGHFMIAQYAPTNWAYRCVHIYINPGYDADAKRRERNRMTQYARAWRPLVPPPTKIPDGGK